jgi:MFS family permease
MPTLGAVFALSVRCRRCSLAAQPFSGAIADRFGTIRVIIVGTLLYAAGIFMMAHASTPGMLYLSSGVLIGFGLSGCSFNLVISSFGKLLPESWRSLAFGAGTASGSFGQFLFSPLGVSLIDAVGWRTTLEIFAGLLLLIIPLAFAIATPRSDAPAAGTAPSAVPTQTYKQALAEALGHRSFILLVLGFFTCGFQLGFVTLHLPAYLIDRGLSAQVGGWTLGAIGLFNIVGAMLSGWLGGRMPKRYILSFIYFTRALAVVFLITLPASPAVALIYGAVTGLLWLSSVPPTSGLVALMFGTLARDATPASPSSAIRRRLPRCLPRRLALCADRLLRRRVVARVVRRPVRVINLPIVGPVATGTRPGLTTDDRRRRMGDGGIDMAAFKAIVIEKAEAGQKVGLTDFDEANLMDGDVTVRVEWSTLNYKDGLAITGKAPVVRRFPMIPGIDFAGTVESSTHPDWRAGDKVILNGWGCGETHLGAYGEKARVNGNWLVRLPPAISAREAMAIGTAGYTAMLAVMALERHGLTPMSGPVVVTGAAGGVGSVAVAILRQRGFQVTARQAGRRSRLPAGDRDHRPQGSAGDPQTPGKERLPAASTWSARPRWPMCSSMTRYGGAVGCGLAGHDTDAGRAIYLRSVSLLGIDLSCARRRTGRRRAAFGE